MESTDPVLEIAKCCVLCTHFTMDVGHDDYYSAMAGAIDCSKGGERGCAWKDADGMTNGEVDRGQLRAVAERCEFFEVSPKLRN